MQKLLSVLPRYRKSLAAALPLAIEIVGQFVGIDTPWYAKAVSVVGVVVVWLAPKNEDAPVPA